VANELNDLIRKVNAIIRSDKNLRTAISTVFAVHKPRIFVSGQTATGAKIGTYGTKPISISKKQQARQTGRTRFPGGYSEYKSAIGKNPGFVILRNTDQMYADYGIVRVGQSYGLGFQNKFNYDKSQWMESKYDADIFDHTSSEIDLLADTLTKQIISQL